VSRPLIAIPARFAASASALRYAAEVNARALVEAVWRAGGEPVSIHPSAPADAAERLARFDGVLLPGGGDLAPDRYGGPEEHPSLYDVDPEQDGFDLAVARQALATGLPLLAICRGLQVVNVARGGTLQPDLAGHRHLVHPVRLRGGSRLARVTGAEQVVASCYHHQRVARTGAGLVATGYAADGTVEALELPGAAGWFAAVQWHPEDTADHDPTQQAIFAALVQASRPSPSIKEKSARHKGLTRT
jgi:putative glutamine amidotransferase